MMTGTKRRKMTIMASIAKRISEIPIGTDELMAVKQTFTAAICLENASNLWATSTAVVAFTLQ